ncbi:MAG TPA: family 16 glycoside hydrolase [Anaerolineales bacterium]|nr:family 16 glycoside hydrolase [Anaerolineales bacterium]
MDNATTEKKGFLQNDRLLVFSLLSFYGLCILGCVGAVFWGLNRANQTISANATSTASVNATEQALGTATALVHTADQDLYEFIERFDQVSARWFVGVYDKRYSDARIAIRDGVYIWDIANSKDYTLATDFYKGNKLKDFDVYLDSKFVKSSKAGKVCSGFDFRRPSQAWTNGAYIFTICNDSHYEIQFYDASGWQVITYSDYENLIHLSEWNRIEISARGEHFEFFINNSTVFEMTDDRLEAGSLGIFIDLDKDNSAEIWFDNFGYQSR